MDTDRAPRACTVSELESIQSIPSGSSHGIMSEFCKGRFWPSLVRNFHLESIWILRPLGLLESKHSIMQHAWLVRESSCGFGPSSPCMHSCLAWSRFGRSGQKTNTASCVYSAMIEGMRYKVYLLLQGRVVHPVMDMDRALRACTVPALKSIRELRSDNKHGIMRLHCDDRTSRRVPEWT